MEKISLFDTRNRQELIDDWHKLFYNHCRSIIHLRIEKANGAFDRNYNRFLWTFNKLYSKDPLAISYYIDSVYDNGFDFYYLYYYFNASKVYPWKLQTIHEIAMHEWSKRTYKELGQDTENYSDELDLYPIDCKYNWEQVF